jgi:hypothetical protein
MIETTHQDKEHSAVQRLELVILAHRFEEVKS